MEKNITCIVCPIGCSLLVTKMDNGYKVEGSTCKRGEKYGVEELTNPKRVVTSTVKLEKSYLKFLPVKTKEPIAKDMIFDVMNVLNNIRVYAPIKVGDIIVKNILDTEVDIVSSKSVDRYKKG